MSNRLHMATIITLSAVSEALAQTTSPTTPTAPAVPATTDGGGLPWLWIIIALVIVAGLAGYFLSRRSQSTSASGTTTGRANVYDSERRK
jgi:hypothetical protein